MLTVLLAKVMQTEFHESLHVIQAAEGGVTMHCFDFKELLLDSNHCNIERASTYVNDEYVPVFLIFIGVIDSESNSLRFLNRSDDRQACHLTADNGGGYLGFAKVHRDSYTDNFDLAYSQVGLYRLLHFSN